MGRIRSCSSLKTKPACSPGRLPWGIGRAARLLAMCSLAFVLAAPASAVVSELEELIATQQYEAAFELAMEHRFEREGDLDFDFYYGLAAIETGNLSEGVFALERVVMRRPGAQRARLELARGYYLMGEYERANHHFDRVRASEPPPNVVATIDRFQRDIQARTETPGLSISGFVGMSLGYDSNVNNGPAASSVTATDGPFEGATFDLSDNEPRDDGVGGLEARLNLQQPLATGQMLYARGDVNTTHHLDNDSLDTIRYGLRLGARWPLNGLTPDLSVRAQQLRVDGDRFQDQYGVALNVNQELSATRMLFYGLDYARLDHEDNPNRDADLIQGSLGWLEAWRVPFNPQTTLSTSVGRVIAQEDTAGAQANTDRWQGGVNGQVRVALPLADWSLSSRTQYRYSEYSGDNAFFGTNRQDHFGQVSLSAEWTPLAELAITPGVEYRMTRSNIDLYTNERARADVRVRYRF